LMEDFSAILPDGNSFAHWEDKTQYTQVLYVDADAPEASDTNAGSQASPFRTIGAAARIAGPATKIRIHKGVYRETVRPAAGGSGPDGMICYEAFGDGEVVVKASITATQFNPSAGWDLDRDEYGAPAQDARIWEIRLNPEEFMGYNPFCAVNVIHDRLFLDYGKVNMIPFLNRRGMVFVDGKPMRQAQVYAQLGERDNTYWVEANGQRVHVRLSGDADPHDHDIELTCREQCFAPEEAFTPYIRVSGLTFAHASMGAPVPQRGAVSCGRGHHWIIEGCTIDWSNAVGIDCGNECWQYAYDKERIYGNSIIRRNIIRDAGVCGIAAIRSQNLLIEDNLIEGTGWQGMELAWESGGIKLHHGVNALIRRNIIRNTYGGDAIWLDCDHINCRITGNLLINGKNVRGIVYLECNRDYENMIDNNIIWNAEGRCNSPNTGRPAAFASDWYNTEDTDEKLGFGIYLDGTDETRIVNNLIGHCHVAGQFASSVAFRLQNGRGGTNRDTRVFNNIFYKCGAAALKLLSLHNEVEGNIYARMPQGYLRVLKPEVMCLDLPAWRKYCGYDITGAEAPLDISVDGDTLTMEVTVSAALPENPADPKAACDYFGAEQPEKRIAGPFPTLGLGRRVLSIDPRSHSGIVV